VDRSFSSLVLTVGLTVDCPVPRLTLLFFGAAKDIPEAAEKVTAGTACPHFAKQANGQNGSSRATAPEQVQHQGYYRHNQQEVNQPASHVESEKSEHPQHQQNKKQP
jgi:hypothetical protein